MKYLHKYESYIKENFFAKILYKLFGRYIDRKFDSNNKTMEIAKRLSDPKLSLPELIYTGEIKAYNLAIRGYKHFYPKNDLIEDCEFMLKKFQEDLWKDKQNHETLSDAIYAMNKFIEYYKNRIEFYDGDISINPNI